MNFRKLPLATFSLKKYCPSSAQGSEYALETHEPNDIITLYLIGDMLSRFLQ
jgi:hypothetical protein